MLEPSRLLLRRATAPLLLLLLGGSHANAAGSTQQSLPACKRLTDNSSPFIVAAEQLSAIGGLTPATLDASVFAPLERSLPAFSTCLAQTNPVALISSLLSSSPKALRCWTDLAVTTDAEAINSKGELQFGAVICPALDKRSSCLLDVLLPALDAAFSATNGCCDPFLNEVESVFGAPFKPAIATLFQVIDNALCTKRVATGSTKTEVCGDSLVKNWLAHIGEGREDGLVTLVNSFQVPNDQLCRAAKGEAFVTTANTTQRFGGDVDAAYGACIQPMETLAQYVYGLPYWESSSDTDAAAIVGEMFAVDQCLPGKDFLKWASNEEGFVMNGAHALDAVVSAVAVLLGENQPPPGSPTLTPPPTPVKPRDSEQSSGGSLGTEDDAGSGGSSDVIGGSDGSNDSSGRGPNSLSGSLGTSDSSSGSSARETSGSSGSLGGSDGSSGSSDSGSHGSSKSSLRGPEISGESSESESSSSSDSSDIGSRGPSESSDFGSSGSSGSSDIGSSGSSGSSDSRSDGSSGSCDIEPNESNDSTGGSGTSDTPVVFDNLTDGDGDPLAVFLSINFTEIVRSTLSQLEPVAAELCLHIPNGVACDFAGEELSLPFPEVEIKPGGDVASSPQPTATAPKPALSGGATISEGATTTTTNSSNSTSTDSQAARSPQRHSLAFVTVVLMLTALVL